MTPAESAIEDLYFDASFKSVHDAKVELGGSLAEWPFRENGAERIYAALVKVDFANWKCVLKSFMYVKMGCEQ